MGSSLDDRAASNEPALCDSGAPTAPEFADDSASAEPDQNACADGATAGDAHERFARLVLPHLDAAYTLARWITGDGIDAEDVVQEACLRTFRAGAIVPDDRARSFVLTAVRKAAFAWLRDYRPARFVSADEFGPSDHAQMRCWDADGESPESALIAKTDATTLAAAISRLPMPFREALVMRDICGLSYREIAEQIGVPIGTVMSRLARGRRRIIKGIGTSMRRKRN